MSDYDLDIQIEPAGFVDQPRQGSPFDDFVVLLSQHVVQQIKEHTEPHLNHEMGGVLIGNIWENNGVIYVDIKESLPSQVKGNFSTLSFTVETWRELEQQHQRLFSQYKKIGWYHSHLGYGVFLSPLDTFLHQFAFSLPWQIALVYDPMLSEYGVFRWSEGELIATRFYLTSDRDTFQEPLMSKAVGHHLHVLAGYLDDQPGKETIVDASRHIQLRLKQLAAEDTIVTNPVEDALTTVIEVAGIDADALSQAKTMLKGLLGQELLLGQNVNLASSLKFHTKGIVLTQQNVYFMKEKALFWSARDQGAVPSTITVPTVLQDITANQESLFALDKSGTIYIVPLPPAESNPAHSKNKKKRTNDATYIELQTFIPPPLGKKPVQAITVRNNTLYMHSTSEVWILPLDSGLGNMWPKVFSLDNIKGASPIHIQAIAVDAQGTIYIADMANSRVLQMLPDGHVGSIFLGDRRRSLVAPISLCISKNELYVLDISIHYIIVYNLESKSYTRHYTWGEFVGNKAIQRLYVDDTEQVYFSAGATFHRLYRLDDRG